MEVKRKKYWRIGEVAKECKVSPEAIRNWEKEIDMTPKRNRFDKRLYLKTEYEYFVKRAKYKQWKIINFIEYIDELERQL